MYKLNISSKIKNIDYIVDYIQNLCNLKNLCNQWHKNKHMQDKTSEAHASQSDFSLVYFYLTAGIAIAIAVFLFVPRVSIG